MNSSESLRNKTLVMIVGPSAIGKSTLMNRVIELDGEFSYSRTLTTRKRREREKQTHYKFISDTEAVALERSGDTLTFLKHPTSGLVYATTEESFPNTYNLLDTLSNTVDQYRKLPFAQTVTISLTAPVEEYRERFLKRYPKKSDEAIKRLEEAKLSITWSLEQTDGHQWLMSYDNKLDDAANKIIRIAQGKTIEDDGHRHAGRILQLIERGIW